MKPVILSDPEIMGGTPCFAGTRVPFQTLLDYLKAGEPLEEFLDGFPSVTRDMAIAALQEAGDMAIAHANGTEAAADLREGIARGEKAIEEGRTLSQAQARRRFARWLK